ncbi:MAG: hypothetical protein AAF492_17055, partial [Verrucomicrobiota bacterium]
GACDLEWETVKFRTTLPGHDEQKYDMMPAYLFEKMAFAKLFDVKLFCIDRRMSNRATLDMSQPEHNLYLEEGFYQLEGARTSRPFRWTKPRARVRLRLKPEVKPYRVVVRCLEGGRPREWPAQLKFEVNGQPVLDPGVTMFKVDDRLTEYTFSLDRTLVGPDGLVFLTLKSNGWNPRRDNGISDDRDLGVMLHAIEIKPADETE